MTTLRDALIRMALRNAAEAKARGDEEEAKRWTEQARRLAEAARVEA